MFHTLVWFYGNEHLCSHADISEELGIVLKCEGTETGFQIVTGKNVVKLS